MIIVLAISFVGLLGICIRSVRSFHTHPAWWAIAVFLAVACFANGARTLLVPWALVFLLAINANQQHDRSLLGRLNSWLRSQPGPTAFTAANRWVLRRCHCAGNPPAPQQQQPAPAPQPQPAQQKSPAQQRADYIADFMSALIAKGFTYGDAKELAQAELQNSTSNSAPSSKPHYSLGEIVIGKKRTFFGFPIPFTRQIFNTQTGLLKYTRGFFIFSKTSNSYMNLYDDFEMKENLRLPVSSFTFTTNKLSQEIGKLKVDKDGKKYYEEKGVDPKITTAMQWWWEKMRPNK